MAPEQPTPAAQASPSSDVSGPVAMQSPSKPVEKKPHPARRPLFNKISRETSEYLVSNLSMLISSGVSIGEALDALTQELPDKRAMKALKQMEHQIDEGVPFYKAMGESGLFSPAVVNLVEIGESTGQLPQNLKVIATQMHKNNALASKVRAALMYPSFLLGLLFLVGTGIGVFLLPRLLKIIDSLNVEVGPITKALIALGTFFGRFGLIFAGITIASLTSIYVLSRINERVKAASETVLYHIPGIRKLLFESEVARFGFVLGTLMEAGLPVTTCLSSLSTSMSTFRYRKFTAELHQKIEDGDSFSKALANPKVRKYLPGTTCQIIITAEKSGNLSTSLLGIGQAYEDKADITARNLETLLEPVVLVILAVGVLFVALAVFLPIYSLIGNFNGSGK
ncbi:MAG TPA: type II secretion system F family protein [Candidatus Saccharimonadales bacterium]|nr:type II secretion system F family protein [Candidatus Saccharimonadales bacterium]